MKISILRIWIIALITFAHCAISFGQSNDLRQEVASQIQSGIASMIEGRFEEADTFFQRATEIDPFSAEAYYWLTRLGTERGDFKTAIEMGTKALSLDESLYEAHFELFMAYSGLGLKQEAKYHIMEAAKIDPEFVSRKGAALIIEYRDLANAMYFFKAVYSVRPSNVLNALNFGKALLINDDPKTAELILKSAMTIANVADTNFEKLFEMYYSTMLTNKNFSQIVESEFLKNLDSNLYRKYYFQAMSYFHLGDIPKFKEYAARYFQMGGQKKPESLYGWAMAE